MYVRNHAVVKQILPELLEVRAGSPGTGHDINQFGVVLQIMNAHSPEQAVKVGRTIAHARHHLRLIRLFWNFKIGRISYDIVIDFVFVVEQEAVLESLACDVIVLYYFAADPILRFHQIQIHLQQWQDLSVRFITGQADFTLVSVLDQSVDDGGRQDAGTGPRIQNMKFGSG